MRRLMVLCVPAAVGAGLLVAPIAGAAAPACGQTVTQSVTLQADLTGCPGSGLVVGADDITIDLNGHAITGTNGPGGEGIANDGHSGVKIVNGAISGFRVHGIALRQAPRSTVRGVRIGAIGDGTDEPETAAGIFVESSAGTRIIDNAVSNDVDAWQADGVVVLKSKRAVVHGNRLVRNAWNGLAFILSPNGRITGNEIARNRNQGAEVNSSAAPVVTGNRSTANEHSGIVVGAMSGARIAGNTLRGNKESGLFLFGLLDSLVTGNVAEANDAGIDLAGGEDGSRGNRLEGNRTDRNAVGVVVEEGADRNVLVSNVAARNRADGPDDAGIIVDGAANLLARNVAAGNAGHGILAVQGTRDGGGNRAFGNDRSPQCTGVAC
jgi:nitrous oxidase accessory protein NosD